MNLNNIAQIRLINQQIRKSKFKTAEELVSWMGAMQAQDYAMVKWAVGVRLPGSNEHLVEKAIDAGEIIRTHLLRPTWHLVSAQDIYWMLELTAPQIKASMKSRDRELELSETVYSKSNKLIEKALANGNHLKREELIKLLESATISTANNRGSHILFRAELDCIICSGVSKDKSPTYALLAERVVKTKAVTRNEALVMLARRYFSSHGPATLQDFVWWSGLSVADARNALEMIKSEFISVTKEEQTYWLAGSLPEIKKSGTAIDLLPAFDEYMISYRNRNASLPGDINKKVISENGIFRPIIVVNGMVAGIWKRSFVKGKILIDTSFFQHPDQTIHKLIEEKAEAYGRFLNREVTISHTYINE